MGIGLKSVEIPVSRICICSIFFLSFFLLCPLKQCLNFVQEQSKGIAIHIHKFPGNVNVEQRKRGAVPFGIIMFFVWQLEGVYVHYILVTLKLCILHFPSKATVDKRLYLLVKNRLQTCYMWPSFFDTDVGVFMAIL